VLQSGPQAMKTLLFALLLLTSPLAAQAAGLTVFAAASLTDVFTDIGHLWQARGHAPVVFSFAGSSTLAQQIAKGAPADIFASADEVWMDRLAEQNRIQPATRFDMAGNALVLVGRGHAAVDLTQPGTVLALLGQDGRLAVADPAHVPAGLYAAQAMKKLGLWSALQSRLAPAEDVRSALLLVAHGETPAGIVYQTDVKASPALSVLATFPPDSHDPILYPVAATRHAIPEALEFLAFLRTPDARVVFEHYGFPAP
jgi:molybdate transport system substrate-binding protein